MITGNCTSYIDWRQKPITELKETIINCFYLSKNNDVEDEIDKIKTKIIRFCFYLSDLIERYKLNKGFNKIFNVGNLIKIIKYYETTEFNVLLKDHYFDLKILKKDIREVVDYKLEFFHGTDIGEYLEKLENYLKDEMESSPDEISNSDYLELKRSLFESNRFYIHEEYKKGKIRQFALYLDELKKNAIKRFLRRTYVYNRQSSSYRKTI